MNRNITIGVVAGVAVSLSVMHLAIRANPIEINRGAIISVGNICENPETDSGLEYVLVDRYPPYRWVAYCSDGTVMNSRL